MSDALNAIGAADAQAATAAGRFAEAQAHDRLPGNAPIALIEEGHSELAAATAALAMAQSAAASAHDAASVQQPQVADPHLVDTVA